MSVPVRPNISDCSPEHVWGDRAENGKVFGVCSTSPYPFPSLDSSLLPDLAANVAATTGGESC